MRALNDVCFQGDFFELVVNISRFNPEDVKVYVSGQGVLVNAQKKTPGKPLKPFGHSNHFNHLI